MSVLRAAVAVGGRVRRVATGALWAGQDRVPPLPLPSLDTTLGRFLEYAEPLATPAALQQTKQHVDEFARGLGPELQRYASDYAAGVPSHVASYWDDAYLAPRCPVTVNVSPYLVFSRLPGFTNGFDTAAALLQGSARYLKQIWDGSLAPDVEKAGPLDMSQHAKLLCSARIPGLHRDHVQLALHEKPRHVVVLRNNRFYALDILDEKHQPYSRKALSERLTQIARAADLAGPAIPYGVLTAEQRTRWAVRRNLLDARTLSAIDSSILVLCLDQAQNEPDDQLAQRMLCAKSNRWYDKTVQLVVCDDGQAGVNLEHSPCDGHTLLRFMTDVGASARVAEASASVSAAAPPPSTELSLGTSDRIESAVGEALRHFDVLAASYDSSVLRFDAFGKELLKKLKLSPDGCVQMSYQLAYFRQHKRFDSTYESVMTKNFKLGRTEAMRSVTMESCRFARAMDDTGASDADRRKLLGAAVSKHSARAGDCKVGQGIDRHLYTLKCLARDLELPMPALFSDPTYSRVFESVISTSNISSTELSLFGFGPVHPNGYGIGYNVLDNDIVLHVTSMHREAGKFAQNIAAALNDIRKLAERTA